MNTETPVAPAEKPKVIKSEVIKTLTADEVSKLTADQLKGLKDLKPHEHSIFPETRTGRYLDSMYLNVEAEKRSLKLSALLLPFRRAQKALADKKETQYDAANKPLLGADQKPKIIDLSEARARELTALLENSKDELFKLEDEMRALKGVSFHFSKNLAPVIRDVLEIATTEMIVAAAEAALMDDKKIIDVSMLHKNAAGLVCLPLFQNLPLWRSPPEPPAKKAGDAPAAEEPVEPADEQAEEDNGRASFTHYITEICSELARPTKVDASTGLPVCEVRLVKDKNGVEKLTRVIVKSDSKYAKLRTKNTFKQYLNDLLFEFLASISPMLQQQLRALDVKTLTDEILLSVIETIMRGGQTATERLVYSKVMAADPAAVADLKKRIKAAKDAKTEVPTTKEADLPKIEVTHITKQLVYTDTRFDQFKAKLAVAAAHWKKAAAVEAPAQQ